MSIHVQLDRFEGPLGLLLHLIREQEMDIFNINIHHITRQYLEYIKTMRRLDLEVAGDFVAMASMLLLIKSKMLLPNYNEDGEEISEDPRKELVQKLLEYKKFRELSADLYKRPLLGRDVLPRTVIDDVEALDEGELVLEENPLFSLIASYRSALKNMKKGVHKVTEALQSIASRILEIKDRLIIGQRVVFKDLITAQEGRSGQVLVTFLSLLELAKIGFVSVFQNEPFSDIHIEAKKVIDRDVVSQVESYDSVNAEQKATEIMAEAQLSLEEPVALLEGEEAPVVEAAPTDAASDDEIAAEEALLEKIEGQHILAHDTEKTLLPEEIASDDDIELELARMAAEDRGEVFAPPERPASAETVESVPETLAAAEPAITEESALPAELALAEEVPLTAEVGSTAESTENSPLAAAEAPAAMPEPSLADSAEFVEKKPTRAVEFMPQMIQEMPTEFLADEAAAELIEEARHAGPIEITPDAIVEPDPEKMETIADASFATVDEASPTPPKTNESVNSALSAALSAFDAFNDIKPDGDPEVET